MRDIRCMKTTEELGVNWGPYRPTRRYRFIIRNAGWVSWFSPRYSTVFKPTNADDDKNINNMEKVSKSTEIACKVIGYVGYSLLTIFTGMFILLGIIGLALTIIEADWFNLIGVASCAGAAFMLHSLRKSL